MNELEFKNLLKQLPIEEKIKLLEEQAQAGRIDPQQLNPFDCYEPTPIARCFHLSLAKKRKYGGANRSSKTYGASEDDSTLLLGRPPDSMKDIWVRKIPKKPVHIRIVGVDSKAVKLYLMPGFRDILPPETILKDNTEDGFMWIKSKWSEFDPSVVEFFTGEMKPKAHAGAKRDRIRMDEELGIEYYYENMKRLVGGEPGDFVLSMTPEYGLTWTWEEFDEQCRRKYISVPNPNPVRLPEYASSDEFTRDRHIEVQDYENNKKNNIEVFHTTIYDNQHLTDDNIIQLYDDFKTYPEKREISLLGKTISLSGLVYPQFSRKIYPEGHVFDDGDWLDDELLDPDFPRFIHIDPHTETNWYVLMVCLLPKEKDTDPENIVIEDEFWMGGGLYEIRESLYRWECREKLWKTKRKRRNLIWRLIDPFSIIKNPITKTSMFDDLREEPYHNNVPTFIASKDKDRGIDLVRSAFYFDLEKGIKPTTIVHPRCKIFIEQHKKWIFGKDGKPVDEFDHACESFYRLFLHPNFSYNVVLDNNEPYNPRLMAKAS